MTQQLFLEDCYLQTCTAEVLFVDGFFVELSATVFYPMGGGQSHDTGTLTCQDQVYTVVDVLKQEGKLLHKIDHEGLRVGDYVVCQIDWSRRYRLMRMHTASHLLLGILHAATGALATGNQLDLVNSRVDFDLENYDPSRLSDLIAQANAAITSDSAVGIREISRAQAEIFPSLAKLAKGLHPTVATIRVITLGSYDEQACGGTHLHSLSEIGTIVFVRAENKGKGRRRIYFTLTP